MANCRSDQPASLTGEVSIEKRDREQQPGGEDRSAAQEVPGQIFLGTLVQSVVIVAASLVEGRLSDRMGRRKIFVFVAPLVYGSAMFVIAMATDMNGYLVGMAIGELGFGLFMALDLALVVDVLPGTDDAAGDLGVLNIAGALPASVAPAIGPLALAMGGGYGLHPHCCAGTATHRRVHRVDGRADVHRLSTSAP